MNENTIIAIFGGAWNWESGAFDLSCLFAFLMVIPAWAKIRKKPNEFAKIQVNPTKSNQIRPLFYGIRAMNAKVAKEETPSPYLLNSGFWPLTPIRVQGKSSLEIPMNSPKSR
jgi:hypothetical protein